MAWFACLAIVQVIRDDSVSWGHGLVVDLLAGVWRNQGQVEPLRSFLTEVAVLVICNWLKLIRIELCRLGQVSG